MGDTGSTPRWVPITAVNAGPIKPFSGWNDDLPTGGCHTVDIYFAFVDGCVKWYRFNGNTLDLQGVGVTTPGNLLSHSWFRIDYQPPFRERPQAAQLRTALDTWKWWTSRLNARISRKRIYSGIPGDCFEIRLP